MDSFRAHHRTFARLILEHSSNFTFERLNTLNFLLLASTYVTTACCTLLAGFRRAPSELPSPLPIASTKIIENSFKRHHKFSQTSSHITSQRRKGTLPYIEHIQ
jgi:hypothetical protein